MLVFQQRIVDPRLSNNIFTNTDTSMEMLSLMIAKKGTALKRMFV